MQGRSSGFRPLRGLYISKSRCSIMTAKFISFRPLRGLYISKLDYPVYLIVDKNGFRPLRGLYISKLLESVSCKYDSCFRPLRGLYISKCFAWYSAKKYTRETVSVPFGDSIYLNICGTDVCKQLTVFPSPSGTLYI